MEEPSKPSVLESPAVVESQERTKRVTGICWAAGTVGFFAVLTLSDKPTWPAAFAVASLAAMFYGIAHLVLKRD